MRAFVAIALVAALAGAAGCNSRRGVPLQTKPYAGVEQGALTAWAWGGAPGFEADGAHDVVVLVDPEPGDSNHRLMSCDPKVDDCKAMTDFSDTGLEPETDASSLFARFETGIDKQDRLLLAVADRGAKLVTSEVIVASMGSRPTSYDPSALRFDRTTQLLSWPRSPDGSLFIVAVNGPNDTPLTAISTRRKSWVYPELQGIVQYIHDPAHVPELRPGSRYVATLYAVNKQGWAVMVSNAVIKP